LPGGDSRAAVGCRCNSPADSPSGQRGGSDDEESWDRRGASATGALMGLDDPTTFTVAAPRCSGESPPGASSRVSVCMPFLMPVRWSRHRRGRSGHGSPWPRPRGGDSIGSSRVHGVQKAKKPGHHGDRASWTSIVRHQGHLDGLPQAAVASLPFGHSTTRSCQAANVSLEIPKGGDASLVYDEQAIEGRLQCCHACICKPWRRLRLSREGVKGLFFGRCCGVHGVAEGGMWYRDRTDSGGRRARGAVAAASGALRWVRGGRRAGARCGALRRGLRRPSGWSQERAGAGAMHRGESRWAS